MAGPSTTIPIYVGSGFRVEQKRRDTYQETSGTPTHRSEYLIITNAPATYPQALGYATSFITAKGLRFDDNNIPLKSIELDHDNEDDRDMVWTLRTEWAFLDSSGGGGSYEYPKQDVGALEDWSTEGETVHITQAIAETNYDADPNDPVPDTYGVIGANGEGCDVITQAFGFTLKKKLTFASDDDKQAFQILCGGMTGTVNSSTWRGFAAGTVLFQGVSATEVVEYPGTTVVINGVTYLAASIYWDATFKFKFSPDVSNLTVGNTTVTSKGGHEYFWAYYRKTDDPVTGITTEAQMGVKVDTVYQSSDFTDLGL